MPYLSPKTIAKAARSLFGTGHSESIVFYFLKAEGAGTDKWIKITSSNEPPPGLLKIAGQPDGFDGLIKANVGKFSDRNEAGLPTRPGARGSTDGYSMFFPITEEPQYILRKRDCNRNAVWSNINGGRNALNSDKAKAEDIFELRDPPDGSSGKEIRFKTNYALPAYWYYGPRRGVPMRVPLGPLAIWMHRTENLPAGTTLEELIRRTIDLLHLNPEELHLIFDRDYPTSLGPEDFVAKFNVEKYFAALCLPGETVEVPKVTISEKQLAMDQKRWQFMATALGLKKDAENEAPLEVAKSLLRDGARNLLFYGPPRTGKSRTALKLASEYLGVPEDRIHADPRFKRVQFHQGWTYGDFIRKLMPTPAKGGGLEFKKVDGCFLKHCLDTAGKKSVFIIDEINRANLADVFGEAFQVVETGYRGIPIDLSGSTEEDKVKSLTIPKDLLLIATGNDLDKTTLPLDFAFMSRFSVVNFPVQYNLILDILSGGPGWARPAAEKFLLLLREVEEICGYPVGHASFYSFGKPDSVVRWYKTSLRPLLVLHLTRYREEELQKIDSLFLGWQTE